MKSNLTFAIDVDDVLRFCTQSMVDIYNKEFNDNMSLSDIKHYNVDISFPRIKKETGISAAEWFFHMHSKEVFSESGAITGAKEAIDILREHGRIVIVTKQSGVDNKKCTLDWLDKYNFYYDDICFVTDKTIVDCDYLIDDYMDNFYGFPYKTTAIIINAPYNKYRTIRDITDNSSITTIKRFDSILDFAKDFVYLKKFKKVNE